MWFCVLFAMNTKRILAALIPSIVVLILLSYIWGVNLVFILASELSIETSIDNRTILATNQQIIPLTFTSRVDSPSTCSTTCDFTLREVATNKTVHSESLLVRNFHESTIPYTINKTSKGTLHLSYTAKCSNIVSAFCSTQEDPYYETSFITIHHEQTQDQRVREEVLKKNIVDAYELLNQITATIDESLHLIEVLPNVSQVRDKASELEHMRLKKDRLAYDLEQYLTLWRTDQYEEIQEIAFTTTLSELSNVHRRSDEDLQTLQTLLQQYITLREIQNNMRYDVLIYLENRSSFARESLQDLIVLENTTRYLSFDSITKQFELAQKLNEEVLALVRLYDQVTIQFISQVNNDLSPWSTNLTNITAACEFLNTTRGEILRFNNQIDLNSTNSSNEFLQNESLIYYEDPSFTLTYPNKTMYHNKWLEDIDELSLEYCTSISTDAREPFLQLDIPEFQARALTINLSKLPQPCCVYGECSSCQQSYPLILIHGHALTSVTSPEAALHSFSKIQYQLENEGYVNVGELNDYPIKSWQEVQGPISVRASYYFLSYAEFGQYQFHSKKYESIENYAIRLKEIIDDVKVKTGSDKVVILAHSMGGLVTRQYLAIFGEDDVEKAILIATPNNGVIGAAKQLCSLTGADRECEEMAQGSVFLGRLNQFVPTQTKIYTVVGKGCSMNGLEADGVVTLDSVLLPYANNTIVEGTCSDALNSEMHKALIDPDEYPIVYERIVEILEE